MEPIDYFRYIHLYQRAVRRGLVEDIKCFICEEEVSVMLGQNDHPEKVCWKCGVRPFTYQELEGFKLTVEKIFND